MNEQTNQKYPTEHSAFLKDSMQYVTALDNVIAKRMKKGATLSELTDLILHYKEDVWNNNSYIQEHLAFQLFLLHAENISHYKARAFKVFDTLYLMLADAEEALKGWEHKETIQEGYAVVDIEDFKDFLYRGFFHLEAGTTFTESTQEAQEAILEHIE